MSSNLVKEIIKEVRSDLPLQLSGITPTAQAYFIDQMKSDLSSPLLIICPSSDLAVKMHQDLKFFREKGHTSTQDLAHRLDFLPSWEQSPYLSLSPSVKSRLRRLRALDRILKDKTDILICDVEALAQKIPSPDSLLARSFEVSKGELYDRGELTEKLLAAGYSQADLTEDPGQFSIRGSILDVFSPSYPQPVRIDFFDIEVENMKFFDPNTQKSFSESISKLHVIPVQPYALTPETIAVAKARIKDFCDTHEISKKTRDEWTEKLSPHRYLPELEYFFPLFADPHKGSSSILELFRSRGWIPVVSDTLGCESSLDRLYARIKKDHALTREQKKIAPEPHDIFEELEKLTDYLSVESKLRFNFFQIGVPEAALTPEESESIVDIRKPSAIHAYVNEEFSNPKTGLDLFAEKSRHWREQGTVHVLSATTQSQAERVRFLLEQKGVPSQVVERYDLLNSSALQIVEGDLSSGFRITKEKIAFFTDAELFGLKKLKAKAKREESAFKDLGSFVSSLDDLNPNDFVVHHTHGVGKYLGLTKLEVDRIPQDFLLLEYANADKLYLPVYRLDLIQKYIGSEGSEVVTLDKLGSGQFEKMKSKVKQELEDVAHKLLDLYAKRASREGVSYSPISEDYQRFEARFPFAETQDQLKAIEDIERDMSSTKIMDRLVCGDVGYGKTEVAMRAAFRAVVDGKQTAVLVPTTVLAFQHERSFLERFKDTPVRVASLSRFKTPKEAKKILEDLKAGQIDIIIGTHRLLSKDIVFKDLGLLIVDEEQRFGVEAKEKIKALKVNSDVLTLTATPIPRTLQMSMMGLRDISIINTAPVDRLAIRTYVSKFDEEVIKRSITNELARGGQVFFIHNRVQSIYAMADQLKSIVPEARILIGHGQMDERALEEVMLDFYNKKADILLCSTIIESGLDVPSANTIIINRADMFGLSQLYQLRGRVGRSQSRAYCYLLLPEGSSITEEAKKRLEVIQRYVELGSGFKIASHDLELRGGGDILGKSQSGHISAIGYEMFMELLDESIRSLKGETVEEKFDPEIKLPIATLIPEDYIEDIHQRLHFYKRLSESHSTDALHAIELEMQDRYGKLPAEAFNLLGLIRIKNLLREYCVKSLTVGKEKTSIEVTKESQIELNKVLGLVQKSPNLYSITPDSRLILKARFDSVQKTHHDLELFLSKVAEPKSAC